MRICIWYSHTKQAWGGSNSFLNVLAREFYKNGHYVTSSPSINDDVILVNSWTLGSGRYLKPGLVAQVKYTGVTNLLGRLLPVSLWTRLSKKGPQIIQRLNGVASIYGRTDNVDQIQFKVAQLADGVIFQSHYSQQVFGQHSTYPALNTVVHNAVDGNLFYPDPSHKKVASEVLRMVAVSWSANPKKGFYWLPRLAEIPGVVIQFIGNWCPAIDPGKVQQLGVLDASKIAQILRHSDVLVNPSEDEACSNAILEGLACGLPVLFRDSGGNKELAGNYGVALTDDLNQVVNELRTRYLALSDTILAGRQNFLIESCANNYIHIFQKALDQRSLR